MSSNNNGNNSGSRNNLGSSGGKNSVGSNLKTRYSKSSTTTKVIIWIVIVLIIILLIWWIVYAINKASQTSTENPVIISSPIDAWVTRTGVSVPQPSSGYNLSYSSWIYVRDWDYKFGKWKNIFWKGNSSVPRHSPSIWLYPLTNSIKVVTSHTGTNAMTSCDIENIPLQKWVHCLVSVYGKSLDVYIDGKLVRTCMLPGIAKVDTSKDVFITPLGGFSGYTSNFQFFPNATNPQEAYNIYKKGFGGSALGNLFNKYRIKIVFLEDNQEQGSFEI